MYTYTLAGGVTARIQLDVPLNEYHKKVLKAHLPGIQPAQFDIKNINSADEDIVFRHREDENKSLVCDNDGRYTLTAPWNNTIPEEFLQLFNTAARLAWLKKSMLVVEGPCIGEMNRSNVLILAQPGLGKTKLTLSCALNKNLEVFSGTKTLLQLNTQNRTLHAVGGTPLLVNSNKVDVAKWQEYGLGLDAIGNLFYQVNLPLLNQSSQPTVKIQTIVVLTQNMMNFDFELVAAEELESLLIPYFLDQIIYNKNIAISEENIANLRAAIMTCLSGVRIYQISAYTNNLDASIQHLAENAPLELNRATNKR
jgi:hypothetical protein